MAGLRAGMGGTAKAVAPTTSDVRGVRVSDTGVAVNSGVLRTIGLASIGVCGVVLAIKLFFTNQRLQDLKSKIISKSQKLPQVPAETLRSQFSQLALTESKAIQNHTHGKAAADRSAASDFIARLARVTGTSEYLIQRSRSDERNARDGSRAFYWAKDLNAAQSSMCIPRNPLLAFVDVDQYVDMPEFLSTHVHPYLLYTFQPDQVAKVSENYSYTFDNKSVVNYYVTGGAKYEHAVWNYSLDNFSVTSRFFGIPYKYVTYLVDRRSTSPDHELIMCVPTGIWYGPFAWFASWCLSAPNLDRLRLTDGDGFNRLRVCSQAGVMISTGRPGFLACATIPAQVDEAISTIARTGSYTLTMPTVLSFVDGDRVAGAALLDYHKAALKHQPPPVVCPVPQGVRRYQFDAYAFEPNAKPTMVAFMSPLVHGAFCPDQTLGNEVASIEGRVENVKPNMLAMTPFLSKVMAEFVEQLIPELQAHTLDPVDYDEVKARQARPSQRMILGQAESIINPMRMVNMFIKKESYANIKPPRSISTINGADKRDYSAFIYALDPLLKSQPWYAFGHKPIEVAARVASVCTAAQYTAVNSDFSKFDGHGSNLMREFEKMILTRAFRLVHIHRVLELHNSQFGLRGVSRLGAWYLTDYTRASGSPETSCFNSLVNAFIAYLALRKTKLDGVFIQAQDAWRKLGIYGGDDGLTADVDPVVYKDAALMLGQDLSAEPIKRGCLGVKFLARVYSPNVWYGDDNSCCDLPRQLAKFHVAVPMNSNVTPQHKLLEKVRSFLLTDMHTPILGAFCQRVLFAYGSPEIIPDDLTEPMRTWLSRFEKNVQYPNQPESWMMDYAEVSLPNFDFKRFSVWLGDTKTMAELMSPPMFMPPPEAVSKDVIVVDHEVLPRGTVIGKKPPRAKPPDPKRAGVPEVKETFDQMRERKIKAGTWVERKDRDAPAGKQPPKGKEKAGKPPAKPQGPGRKMGYRARR